MTKPGRMHLTSRVLVSMAVAITYLVIAWIVASVVLLNTGTCEMADCEDLKSPVGLEAAVLMVTLTPFVLLLVALVRWITGPVRRPSRPQDIR